MIQEDVGLPACCCRQDIYHSTTGKQQPPRRYGGNGGGKVGCMADILRADSAGAILPNLRAPRSLRPGSGAVFRARYSAPQSGSDAPFAALDAGRVSFGECLRMSTSVWPRPTLDGPLAVPASLNSACRSRPCAQTRYTDPFRSRAARPSLPRGAGSAPDGSAPPGKCGPGKLHSGWHLSAGPETGGAWQDRGDSRCSGPGRFAMTRNPAVTAEKAG